MIAISGGGRAGPGSYLLMASKLGADHIMSKPFLPSELVQKVKELLGLNIICPDLFLSKI